MKKKKIIVLAFMGGCPITGMIWQHIHYIVELQRLGHEVFYVEDTSRFPYNPSNFDISDDYGYAVQTLTTLAKEHGFEGRWAYCARYRETFESPPPKVNSPVPKINTFVCTQVGLATGAPVI